MKTDSRWKIAALVMALLTCVSSNRAKAQCVGDIVRDGRVDGGDLGVMLAYWGPRTAAVFSIASDLNQDGQVDGVDLGLLLASWGVCAGPSVPGWATLIEPWPDPAVVTDAAFRQAIAASGWAWRVRDTATQIEMLLVPPGTFQMGCSPSVQFGCYPVEFPVHEVTLTDAFYLGRYEVKQAQWQATTGSNPSSYQSASNEVPAAEVPNRPVEGVSWNMVQEFLAATGMRLPAEAEWEYAYRAGTMTSFHGYTGQLSGTNADNLLGNIAWFNNSANNQPRPVGGKLGNGFGLHDMSGNVWEWVNDLYGSTYYSTSPSVNPQGPSSSSDRVLRGGSWLNGSGDCRASHRNSTSPANPGNANVGFRVARNP